MSLQCAMTRRPVTSSTDLNEITTDGVYSERPEIS